jgi:hypothetical protein
MANRRPLVIIDGLKQGIGAGDSLDIATGQTYNVGGEPHTHADVEESVTINRTDGEISSLAFEGGKTITINRVAGEIVSVYDGTYTKTIVRENGEITEVIVT